MKVKVLLLSLELLYFVFFYYSLISELLKELEFTNMSNLNLYKNIAHIQEYGEVSSQSAAFLYSWKNTLSLVKEKIQSSAMLVTEFLSFKIHCYGLVKTMSVFNITTIIHCEHLLNKCMNGKFCGHFLLWHIFLLLYIATCS